MTPTKFVTTIIIGLGLWGNTLADTPPTAAATPTSCPTGFSCCPDMSSTMVADETVWQRTGQPLATQNVFSMAWWTLPNGKGTQGYVTCYYNMAGSTTNQYTLESIFPTDPLAANSKTWKKSPMKGTMTCDGAAVNNCPFVFSK
jgi:hypothetical protein